MEYLFLSDYIIRELRNPFMSNPRSGSALMMNTIFFFQMRTLSWPAYQTANRRLHVSCNCATKISSTLEDRISGAALKVVENRDQSWKAS